MTTKSTGSSSSSAIAALISKSIAAAFSILKAWKYSKTSNTALTNRDYNIVATPELYTVHETFTCNNQRIIEYSEEPPHNNAKFIISIKIIPKFRSPDQLYSTGYVSRYIIYKNKLHRVEFIQRKDTIFQIVCRRDHKIDRQTEESIIAATIGML